MADKIAIFRHKKNYSIGFKIGGCWSPVVSTTKGRVKTWPTEKGARQYLRGVEREYRQKHGESLGWDVDGAPVIPLERKER
jgi:hypothetical protein